MKKVSRKSAVDHSLYERQANLCKAFANPTRIHLLEVLSRGQAGASELQEQLGISKANLSQHLTVLRGAGVVHTRREGKRLVCALSSRDVKRACDQMKSILKNQGRQRHL